MTYLKKTFLYIAAGLTAALIGLPTVLANGASSPAEQAIERFNLEAAIAPSFDLIGMPTTVVPTPEDARTEALTSAYDMTANVRTSPENRLDALDIEPTERTTTAVACNILHTKVYFEPGASSLEIHDFPVLDALADCLIEKNPEAVAVVGYTDRAGGWDTNRELARDRAETVIAYLSEAGVDSEMFMPIAVGEATASDTDEVGDAGDRRTELWIVE